MTARGRKASRDAPENELIHRRGCDPGELARCKIAARIEISHRSRAAQLAIHTPHPRWHSHSGITASDWRLWGTK